jgi:hypothetical protein
MGAIFGTLQTDLDLPAPMILPAILTMTLTTKAGYGEMDLEGIVCKRLQDQYGPNVRWWKVLNKSYTQKERRHELFERRYG